MMNQTLEGASFDLKGDIDTEQLYAQIKAEILSQRSV